MHLPQTYSTIPNIFRWYSVPLSSAAISLLIYDLPYQVRHFWVFGAIVYIASLVLFLALLLTHIVRFVVRPALIKASILHPTEGLYVGLFPATLAIFLINGATYAHKLHGVSPHSLLVFWWIYVVLSFVSAIGIPLAQFRFRETQQGPQNLVTTIPLVFAGATAAKVLSLLPTKYSWQGAALGIAAFAVAIQAVGTILALLQQSVLINRFHLAGLPAARERPSLFIAVLAPALTSLAATALGEQALRHFPANTNIPGNGVTDIVGGLVLYHLGIVLGVGFWGLAVWWFCISAASNLSVLARGELGLKEGQLQVFMVVLAHVVTFLAGNELLAVFGWPKGLTVVNEIFGVATIVVWACLVLVGIVGVITGRYMRD
jgi:tellurite resistance protein TehA-like permease